MPLSKEYMVKVSAGRCYCRTALADALKTHRPPTLLSSQKKQLNPSILNFVTQTKAIQSTI